MKHTLPFSPTSVTLSTPCGIIKDQRDRGLPVVTRMALLQFLQHLPLVAYTTLLPEIPPQIRQNQSLSEDSDQALPTEIDIEKEQAIITLRGVLIVLNRHELEIYDSWRNVRDGMMPLCDASVITSLAINSVVALEAEFKKLHGVAIKTLIAESYQTECAGTGKQIPGWKIDFHDSTRFSIAEDHCIKQFWIIGKLWHKIAVAHGKEDWETGKMSEYIEDAVSDNFRKMLPVSPLSLEGQSDTRQLKTCHQVLTSAARQLYLILGVLMNGAEVADKLEQFTHPVQDPIIYLIIKKYFSKDESSLALAFAFKVYHFINSILGPKTTEMPAEYETMCRNDYLKPIIRCQIDVERAFQGATKKGNKHMLAETQKILKTSKDSIMTMIHGSATQ